MSILLGTPFAIFGALFALWVARQFSTTFENNVFTQISLVMLIAMAAVILCVTGWMLPLKVRKKLKA